MAPLLGYWKIRGLAQPIRLVFEYAGADYKEKYYESSPPPDNSLTQWTSEKYRLGLDLPNLPYYIDGDFKLTQTTAILHYIGRKYDLCGQSEEEKAVVDMLMEHVKDMHKAFVKLCYSDYTPEEEKMYLDNLVGHLKLLSDMLGIHHWFVGDKITLADFMIYEELDINKDFSSTCLDNFKNLEEYRKRFEEIPSIKKYMASPRYIKRLIHMPYTKFELHRK